MPLEPFPVKVDVVAYSGYKVNERPLHFILDGRRRRVVKIVDRWCGVEHDYFKVLTDDALIFLLKWLLYMIIKMQARLYKRPKVQIVSEYHKLSHIVLFFDLQEILPCN